ncbi:hypothetical protein MPSEU_000957300 [Mayamaea pseudoterrestris]|nr:hypothetical protein MPSEU_000957300 [Mayamaea pseudoterrestris]
MLHSSSHLHDMSKSTSSQDQNGTFLQAIQNLRKVGLDKKDVSHHASLRRASVMVLLVPQENNDVCLLLTQRSFKLRSHPGEVCFPGGKQDQEDDENDVTTALRETHEEIGLERHHIDILCRLRSIESLHHLCVTPIVGYIHDSATSINLLSLLTVNSTEVESVFLAPLALFHRAPLHQLNVDWSKEIFVMRHYEYTTTMKQVYEITGLTAHIAHQVAEIALGTYSSTEHLTDAVSTATATTAINYSGQVWIQQQSSLGRSYWSKRFLVLDRQILHLHDTPANASSKATSATKKNRMLLKDSTCRVMAVEHDVAGNKQVFVVSVLEGRVEWRMAVETTKERQAWVNAILASTGLHELV